MPTLYKTLQATALKHVLSKSVAERLPLGLPEVLEKNVAILEADLVNSFSNLEDNAPTLLKASFNHHLRGLASSNDPAVASLASSLYKAMADSSGSVSIIKDDGTRLTPEDGDLYQEAAAAELQQEVQAYLAATAPKEEEPQTSQEEVKE